MVRKKTQLRAAEMLPRSAYIASHGLTFGEDRDMYAALGYKRKLTPRDYRARFNRGGIARRVVTAKPQATWRGNPELIENPDPETITAFEAAWFELEDRLHIWNVLRRGDILAGLGRYAVILIGASGDLREELPPRANIAFMQPFSEEEAVIQETEANIESERFGQPLLYSLKRTSSTSVATRRTAEPRIVHYSRIIHLADTPLDEEVFASPRLEPVWNLFDDLEKITGGGAEAYWRNAHKGHVVVVDPTVKMTQEKIDAMKVQAELMAHGMKRTMGIQGGDVKTLGTETSDFSGNSDAVLTQIAGTVEIPKRILLGSEMGELASTQDRDNWIDSVSDRRTQFAEDGVVRPFVDKLIELNILPPVGADGYTIRWPDMDDVSEEERAALGLSLARMNKDNPEIVITGNEIRDRVFGMGPLTPEEMAKVSSAPGDPGGEEREDEDEEPRAAIDRWRDKKTGMKPYIAPSKRLRWLQSRRVERKLRVVS